MDDDNEALDWGNEEDEYQDSPRRGSYDQNGRRDTNDAEDVEDAVSLGDDEDDRGFYSYQREDAPTNALNAYTVTDDSARPASARTQMETLGANDRRGPQAACDGAEPPEPSTIRNSDTNTESLSRPRSSTAQSSPQRLQPRLTHALPAKPVTAKVPYLPPSHPSIVEATSMIISPRAAARDAKKNNEKLVPLVIDLPPNWEVRTARKDGDIYYYNRETHQSTWTLPVSNIPPSSVLEEPRGRPHRHESTGHSRHMTAHDSNAHRSQTSRPTRDASRTSQPDYDMEDATRPLTPDQRVLSFEDRHYRPGGDSISHSVEVRTLERIEISSGPSLKRLEKSPVSPRQQRRPRSLTPPSYRDPQSHSRDQEYAPSRSHRSGRDEITYANSEFSMPRDLEVVLPNNGYDGRRWTSHASTDYPREFRENERSIRREPSRRHVDDSDPIILDQPLSSADRQRRTMKRQESNRGQSRERGTTQAHTFDSLSASAHPSYHPAPRPQSPPPRRDRDYELDRYQVPATAPSRYFDEHPPVPTNSASRKERDRGERSSEPNHSVGQNANFSNGPRSAGVRVQESSLPYGRERDHERSPVAGPPRRPRDRKREGEREQDLTRERNSDFDRDYEQRRRNPRIDEDEYSPRPPAFDYPLTETSQAATDGRPNRYPDQYSRSSPDEPPVPRKRVPLPPQQATFRTLSSTSATVGYPRGPPTNISAIPERQDIRDRDQGWGTHEPSRYVPQQHLQDPLRSSNSRPIGQDYDRETPSSRMDDRYRERDRSQRDEYLAPAQHNLSKLDTRMDVDHEEPPRSVRPYSPVQERNPRSAYREQADDLDDSVKVGRGYPAPQRSAGPRNEVLPFLAHKAPERYEVQPPSRSVVPHPANGTSLAEQRGHGDRLDQKGDRIRPTQQERQISKRGGKPGRISDTNNVPIGANRRFPVIPTTSESVTSLELSTSTASTPATFSVNAKPPPSTFIDQERERSLSSRHDARQRPPHLDVIDPPRRRSPLPLDTSRHRSPPRSGTGDHLDVQSKQAKRSHQESQFFDRDPGLEYRGEERLRGRNSSPRSITSRESRNGVNNGRSTPPPISREPSLLSTTIGQSSAQQSDRGHSSDTRSDEGYHAQPPSAISLPDRLVDATSAHLRSKERDDFAVETPKQEGEHQRKTRWGDSRPNPPPPPKQDVAPIDPEVLPALARRMSTSTGTDRPPRHRKYPSDTISIVVQEPPELATNMYTTDPSGGSVRETIDSPVDLKDRVVRPQVQRRGASLLDRLSLDDGNSRGPTQPDTQHHSLRDRMVVPTKRGREAVMVEEGDPREMGYDGDEGADTKRRRRGAKGRRGGGGGGRR